MTPEFPVSLGDEGAVYMSSKAFSRILLVVLGVCILLTLAHMGYVLFAYKNSSIIKLIACELW